MLFVLQSDNASMPYVMSNYVQLYHFLQRQQQGFQLRHHVWVQNIDRINQCTAFAYQTVEVDHCERLNPFICEMGMEQIDLYHLHFLQYYDFNEA